MVDVGTTVNITVKWEWLYGAVENIGLYLRYILFINELRFNPGCDSKG